VFKSVTQSKQRSGHLLFSFFYFFSLLSVADFLSCSQSKVEGIIDDVFPIAIHTKENKIERMKNNTITMLFGSICEYDCGFWRCSSV